jgi:hypothetical protein
MDENNNTAPLNNLGGQPVGEKGIGAKIGIAIIVIILIAGAVFFFLSKKESVEMVDEQNTENIVTDPENATEEDFMNDLDSSVDVDLEANLMDLSN